MRGVPAIVWNDVSILSSLYACGKDLTSPSALQGAPRKTAAPLKILGVNGVIRVGLSSDLDMPVEHCPGDGVEPQHRALAGGGPCSDGEPKTASGAEVLPFNPAVGFVRMCSPRPAQQLIADDSVRGPKGFGGADIAVIIYSAQIN